MDVFDFLLANLRAFFGLAVLIGICYAFSTHRSFVKWRLVGIGVLMQVVFAFLVFFTPLSWLLDWMTKGVQVILQVTEDATRFVMGDAMMDLGFSFAFNVLPTIIVFSVISSVLYYFGILQIIVKGMAWLLSRTLGLSGAESMAAAANVFLGQTEAPLVIKPYLERMTRSEVLCLMTGGMATIAGGVFAAYMQILGGDPVAIGATLSELQSALSTDAGALVQIQGLIGNAQLSMQEAMSMDVAASAQAIVDARQLEYGKHLLTASFISAPAAIVAAKILFPETEPESIDKELHVSQEQIGSNLLDAISRGTTDGLKLAINVGAMLLTFTAAIYLANKFLGGIGNIDWLPIARDGKDWSDLNSLVQSYYGERVSFNLEFLLGFVFAPIAWLLGVEGSPLPILDANGRNDCFLIGQVLGKKTILNEFFGYLALGAEEAFLSEKSIVIATYALCGFANFASIGIQIGGIGAIAPGQRATLSRFGIKSLIGGTIACFMTACVAGLLYEWQHLFA